MINRFTEGQWVVCDCVSKENPEKLIIGSVYQIAGWTFLDGNQIYTLVDSSGELHFSIGYYFREMKTEDFFQEDEFASYSPEAIEILDEIAEKNLEEFGQALDKMFDDEKVNHPSHYTKGNIECIDAIAEATKDLRGIRATDTGNVIKYMWRWNYKNGVEDLKKAQWYLNHLIEKEEKRLKKKEKKLRKHELRLKGEGK